LQRYPAEDVQRGTVDQFSDQWERALQPTPGSPPPYHFALPADAREARSPSPRPTEQDRRVVRAGSPLASHLAGTPAIRPSNVVEVRITHSASRLRCNPFRPRSLQDWPLAVGLYREWLERRVVAASDIQSPLPLREGTADLRGCDVEREIQRIIDSHPRNTAFRLVCGKRCHGRQCHGDEQLQLWLAILDASLPRPNPRELKPTIAENFSDLSALRGVGDLCEPRLPVQQAASDLKDCFNQLATALQEVYKTGHVTLDLQKLYDLDAALRWVREPVLGYGFTNNSNLASRWTLGMDTVLR